MTDTDAVTERRNEFIRGLRELAVEKEPVGNYFVFRRHFSGGVSYGVQTMREEVCERVVVGTEEVEGPDPDAPLVTQTVEKVEWRCAPLLAGSEAA